MACGFYGDKRPERKSRVARRYLKNASTPADNLPTITLGIFESLHDVNKATIEIRKASKFN